MLATFPAPPGSVLEIGPLNLRAYGLMIGLGVVAAVVVFGRMLEYKRVGTRDDAGTIAMWAVVGGIIGARLYHVATDWERFDDQIEEIPQIWNGGLGIPGGLIAGIAVGCFVAHRRGFAVAEVMTCAAPAIPLAQAIGRWGNWFNQELFGRPTDLPWALEVEPEKVPLAYPTDTTFHPTFLYESLWNLALFGVLLWVDRRLRLGPGRLMAVYVAGYGLGRLWIEGLRIDPADELGGLRWNQWVALAAVIGGVAYLLITRGRKWPAEPEPAEAPEPSEPSETSETTETSETSETSDLSASGGATLHLGQTEPGE